MSGRPCREPMGGRRDYREQEASQQAWPVGKESRNWAGVIHQSAESIWKVEINRGYKMMIPLKGNYKWFLGIKQVIDEESDS